MTSSKCDQLRACQGFQAIKTRFLRFYPKPTAFEPIEPNSAAFFGVSADHPDQGATACPKWKQWLKSPPEKISCL